MPAVFLNILRMCLLALWVLLGGLAAAHAESTSEPVSSGVVEKLQDRVIELEKETAVLKAELGAKVDAQDKRIADGIGLHGAQVTMLSNQTSMLGNQTAELGNLIQKFAIGIAVLGLIGGFFAFKRAEQIAKEQSEKWFEDKEKELGKKISHLEERLADVKTHAESVISEMTKTRQGVDDHAAEVHERFDQAKEAMAKGEKTSPEVTHKIEQDAQELNQKPLSQWTVDDLFRSGVYSYMTGDYETALKRWDAVIDELANRKEPNLLVQLSDALFNKGITLDRLGRLQDAITVYNEVVQQFGARSESVLLERVAIALLNKGVSLGQLSRLREEIDVYDDVVQRFGARWEPSLLEEVANALVNKGASLAQLNRSQDAIAAYDEVVKRFGARSEPALLEAVEKARELKSVLEGQEK